MLQLWGGSRTHRRLSCSQRNFLFGLKFWWFKGLLKERRCLSLSSFPLHSYSVLPSFPSILSSLHSSIPVNSLPSFLFNSCLLLTSDLDTAACQSHYLHPSDCLGAFFVWMPEHNCSKQSFISLCYKGSNLTFFGGCLM